MLNNKQQQNWYHQIFFHDELRLDWCCLMTNNGCINDEKYLNWCCSSMINKTMKDHSCYNFGMKKKIMKKEYLVLFTIQQLPNS
jgi:hypothetical protein